MENNTTQSPANPGASRALDFQPPTGNPQDVGGSLQSQTEYESATNQQEVLGEQQNATISVPSNNPAPAPQNGATMANSSPLAFWLLAAVIIVAFAHFIRRRKANLPNVKKSIAIAQPAPVGEKKAVSRKPKKAVTKTGPKKAKKKSANPKKNRKHR